MTRHFVLTGYVLPMLAADLDPKLYASLPIGWRIRLAAVDYLGSRYSRENRWPADRPGLPSSLVREGGLGLGIDCSSFGAYVLITATPYGRWNSARYGELQIFEAQNPWSPIDAVERAGVGSRVPKPVGGLWHVTQAWHDDKPAEIDGDGISGGHFRLSYSEPDDPDVLLVLESTDVDNNVGPRWSRTSWTYLLSKYESGGRLAALGPGMPG